MKKILLLCFLTINAFAQHSNTTAGFVPDAPVVTDQFGLKYLPNTFIDAKGTISTLGTQAATGLYVRSDNSSDYSNVGISIDLGSTATKDKFGIISNGFFNTLYPIYGSYFAYTNSGSGKPIGTTMAVTGNNPWGYESSVATNLPIGVAKGGDFWAISDAGSVPAGEATAKGLESFGSAGTAYGVHAIAQGTLSTTGTAYGIYAKGSGALNNYAGYFEGNVTVTGTFSNPSDVKLKRNIVGIDGALDKVMRLSPSNYEFKTDTYQNINLAKGSHYGFIAQDIEQVFPELVSNSSVVVSRSNSDFRQNRKLFGTASNQAKEEVVETENIKTVNYLEIIPILTKAIQEQQKQIEELKLEVQRLKGK